MIGDNIILPPDDQRHQSVEQILIDMSQQESTFVSIIKLIKIIDSEEFQYSEQIKIKALFKLKNFVILNWSSQNTQMSYLEKQKIQQFIWPAFRKNSFSSYLIKLCKEILAQIIKHQQIIWMPLKNIYQNIQSDESLIPAMHFMIGIVTSFEFLYDEKEKNYFSSS